MRLSSRQSGKESKAPLPLPVPHADRGAPSAGSAVAEKEEITGSPEADKSLKNGSASEEQSGGRRRGLVVRGLPLVFLPHQIETLWEVAAAADAAGAAEEAGATTDIARAGGPSAEVPGSVSAIPMASPFSPTQTQNVRRQDIPRSRPHPLNAPSESPTTLATRPPSPSDQHANLQRKHASAVTRQRKHLVGHGKDVHTAVKQSKSINSGPAPSASRTAALGGSSSATAATVAAPAGVPGPVAGTGSAGGKACSRTGVLGGAPSGKSHLSPNMCADVDCEGKSKTKSDRSNQLRELVCEHLSAARGESAEMPNANACAAVVELHVFSLLFAGTIGLCSEKAALYMSIVAAAVEELEREQTGEYLRKEIRRHTFDPFAKYYPKPPAGENSFPRETNVGRPSSAYPTFSRKEAQKVFEFASDTFAAHSRLYSYCVIYPRKQVTNVNLLYTYIPVVPSSYPVPAGRLTMSELAPEGSSAAPLAGEGSLTPQQERKRSAEAPIKRV